MDLPFLFFMAEDILLKPFFPRLEQSDVDQLMGRPANSFEHHILLILFNTTIIEDVASQRKGQDAKTGKRFSAMTPNLRNRKAREGKKQICKQ
jgi:hypothetical protein